MSEVHIYQTIYDCLRKEIADGTYTVGMRLPTEKELCERYEVSRTTAKRVMDMLANEGIVKRTKGKGTFVVDCAPVQRQSMARTKDGVIIGVILPDFSDAFGGKLLHGIEAECAKNSVNFLFRLSKARYELERCALLEMEMLGIQGLIISPLMREMYNPKLLELMLRKFPVVIIDRQMPGLAADFIGTDNAASVQRIMDYFYELGHEYIAWISPPVIRTTPLELRQNAFIDAHIQHNRVPDRQLWYNEIQSPRPGNGTLESIQTDIEHIEAHLKAHPEITAVFASEYNVAWMVKRAAQNLGLRIPQDLSIACFDLPSSYSQFREFTHIQQDEIGIGQKAVQMLLHRIEEPDTPNEKVGFEGIFNIGRSTAPVRTWDILKD